MSFWLYCSVDTVESLPLIEEIRRELSHPTSLILQEHCFQFCDGLGLQTESSHVADCFCSSLYLCQENISQMQHLTRPLLHPLPSVNADSMDILKDLSDLDRIFARSHTIGDSLYRPHDCTIWWCTIHFVVPSMIHRVSMDLRSKLDISCGVSYPWRASWKIVSCSCTNRKVWSHRGHRVVQRMFSNSLSRRLWMLPIGELGTLV
jgi:hypothetical protein